MFLNAYCFSPVAAYMRGMRERRSPAMTKVLHLHRHNYSYPIASRTGRREACQAGRKQVASPQAIEAPQPIHCPPWLGQEIQTALTMSLTSKSPMALLTGHEARIANDQPSTLITTPSAPTMSHTTDCDAPIARNTPI